MLSRVSGFEYGPGFDAVDVGIIVLDERRSIAAWNEWIARVSGFAKSDVLGRPIFQVFPGLQDTRLPAVIDDAFQAGSSSVLTSAAAR
jgi:PAS domain S-box-containing protein